jgi:hypothetical protein
MTETEWFTTPLRAGDEYVESMLKFLGPRLSRRKQVLLVCGNFRLDYEEVRSECERDLCVQAELHRHVHALHLQVVEVAERVVDGIAATTELDNLQAAIESELAQDPYPHDLFHNTLPDRGGRALNLVRLARGEYGSLLEILSGDMPYVRPFPYGNPHREACLVRDVVGNPYHEIILVDPIWLAWNGGAVRKIVQAIYDERRFTDLPILADALIESGCTEDGILRHCRDSGPHVRGCWVVDLLLGKKGIQ